MKFSDVLIRDIKQRLLPSHIVGRKVSLQSKGHGEFYGLCPFHKEKTPSFTVSDSKGFYYCFGCGAKGDILKFCMECEGLSFHEAVEYLAKEAGVNLPVKSTLMSPQAQQQHQQHAQWMAVMEAACQFFITQLQSPVGRKARDYLTRRGFTTEIIQTFRLGYAPDQWHGLHHHLTQGGKFSQQHVLDMGLLSKNERGEVYDRFRGRVMFPIMDLAGKVVAFGGRVLEKEEPKYLNSPETELFKKGRLLYNYHLAKPYALKQGEVIVTEGYVDTIALAKVGIMHTVASLGTAITPEQLQLLWRVSKKPIMCLDGDAAGVRAMERVAQLAMPLLQPGHSLMFAQLPSPYDPDDIVTKLGGVAMREILAKAKPLSEVVWEAEYKKQDVTIPEQKADLERRLMQLVNQIEDKSVATHYRLFFRQQLWQMGTKKKQKEVTLVQDVSSPEERGDIQTAGGCEFMLMSIIAIFPELLKISSVYEEWLNIEFSSNKLDNIRSIVLQMADSKDECCRQDIESALQEAGSEEDILLFHALKEKGMGMISSQPDAALHQWNYMLKRYHLVMLKTEYKAMLSQMTEEGLQRAYSLKQTIDQLEVTLNQTELAFGESH